MLDGMINNRMVGSLWIDLRQVNEAALAYYAESYHFFISENEDHKSAVHGFLGGELLAWSPNMLRPGLPITSCLSLRYFVTEP